jgi:hypothetical protein
MQLALIIVTLHTDWSRQRWKQRLNWLPWFTLCTTDLRSAVERRSNIVQAASAARIPQGRPAKARRREVIACIRIDRKMHMELAWNRQLAADAALDSELQRGPEGQVWDVRDLRHLERVHQVAGSRVVVVCAYSRSCGCCKRVLEHLETMSRQVRESAQCT